MKKIFFAALAALLGLVANAQQQFDELDLLGKWTVVSRTGWLNNSISRCGGFYFGDIYYENGKYTEYYATGAIYDFNVEKGIDAPYYHEFGKLVDFFISNGNKLHILLNDMGGNQTLHFVIDELTETTMRLHTFDNSCQLVLTKVSSSLAEAKSDDSDALVELYNLRGERVSNPESGVIIERRGSTVTKRLY